MASLKVAGFCSVVCLVLAIFILLPSSTSAETALASHYESYTYTVAVANYQCYTYYYTYCYNWWYWNYWYWGWYWYPYYYYGWYWNPWYGYGWRSWCDTYPRTSCYYYYTYETRTAQRCQAGWVGSQCNVPTCTPACSPGMVCVDLNKCGCADGSASANCQLLPCSPTNNCYPGTCVSGQCKCPPGFNGPNCINFDHKPSITSCSVKLFAQLSAPGSPYIQVAQADCAAEGLTPPVTWINGPLLDTRLSSLGLAKIEPAWTASYLFPTAMPGKPQGATQFFILYTPVRMGIYDGSYNITFPASNFVTKKIPCSTTTPLSSLPTTATCDNPTTWSDLLVNSQIGHNKSMIVSMTAVLGGTKTGDSQHTYIGKTYGFGDQQFIGTPVVVQSMLKFDLRPPTHCVLLQAGSITAGNDRINCTLYPIYLDQDIRTNPVIKPLFLDWSDDGSGIQKFHVEVFFMQPDPNGVLQPTGGPLQDSVADVTQQLNNYQFTVPTSGVYSIVVTAYDYANNSATARKIFNYMNQPSYTITSEPVYIQEANSAVNHSFITALTNRYQLTLVWTGRFQPHPLYDKLAKRVRPLSITQNTIDDIYGSQFGQRSINAVDNQTGISSYTVRYLVDSENGGLTALPTDTNDTAIINGETATLTFTDPLKDGDTVVVWLTATGSTGNQTTYKLNVGIDTTRPNVSDQSFVKNGVDQYTSRVTITVVDKTSGINSTRYRIVDKRSGVEYVSEKIVAPVTRLAPNRKKRDAMTGFQTVCAPSDTTCYCTPFEQCLPYSQTIDIDNCLIDKYAGEQFVLEFHYWITNKAGLETAERFIPLGDITGATCRPNSLSPGAIAGIVIGCILGFLILVFLVIFIVVIIIRIRQHQHPIPSRKEWRTMAGTVRNRLTMRKVSRENQNQMYASGPQVGASNSKQFAKSNNAYVVDEEYVSKDDLDSFKISKKQVQIADVLAEGKFAVVRKAFYMKTNNKETVAAKALRNGFSQKDELLMTKKISFMKEVPVQGNIVQFIGYIDESDGQGPIMILELCDYPLKDWLANLSNISTDDLELMLTFTLNIAQGVAHLHNHQIIHRRLAVRNVLLKQQANGLVAKLIGFGPSAEDDKSDGAGTGVSLPLKWMAPETIDSINSSKTVYNEKTDAWSFGITVWEIYSLGAGPYGNVKSGDIKSQVKRGLRLQCPQECPPELFSTTVLPCWKESAKQRPAFTTIVQNIQQFRSGSARPQSGYYGTDVVDGRETYTNQEMYHNYQ